MNKTIIDRIKKTVIDFSSQGASKVEEAARSSKLRLDVISEKSKLQEKYASLGQKAFQAIQGANQSSLSEDPNVVELVGAISENLQRIDKLEASLQATRENSSCCTNSK